MLLPGITSPAAVWDFVAEPLAAARTIHVLDLRGRGRSEAAPDGRYGLADYADDAARAIDALALERPTVVGHSLGARIAGALAVDHPDLTGPLVLVDPPLSGPGRAPYPYPLDFYLDGIEAARAGLDVNVLRRDLPGWTDRQLHARATWLGTCDPRAVAETHRNFQAEDFFPIWDRLIAPTLITGSASPVVDADGLAELQSRNPTAVSVVVEGAGHMVPWERPAEFVAVLEAALMRRAMP